jgi:hypothetical protein
VVVTGQAAGQQHVGTDRVSHDTDALDRELFGDVERLTEGGHHTTVGREHRMHRLDRQHHPSRPGILDEFPDRVAGPLPGAGQVPVTGRKLPATRTSTGAGPGAPAAASAAVSSIARRSSARAADRRTPGSGEEASPAQAGHSQVRVCGQGARLLQAHLGDRFAPEPDRPDASLPGDGEGVGEGGVLDRRLVQGQPRVRSWDQHRGRGLDAVQGEEGIPPPGGVNWLHQMSLQ